jgi:hypothetical protein
MWGTSFAKRFLNSLLHVIEPIAPSDSIGKKLMIASRIVRTRMVMHKEKEYFPKKPAIPQDEKM